eukprot:6202647-Pleurochrysis_carterae.AAC.3
MRVVDGACIAGESVVDYPHFDPTKRMTYEQVLGKASPIPPRRRMVLFYDKSLPDAVGAF